MGILSTIDKQKSLRRDCIYNNEITDLEIGVSGIYLHLLYFDTDLAKVIFQNGNNADFIKTCWSFLA